VIAAALALAGLGLVAIDGPNEAALRLSWLAAHRWPPNPAQRAPARSGRAIRLPRLATPAGAVTCLSAAAFLTAGAVPALLVLSAAVVIARCWQVVDRERKAEQSRADLLAAVRALRDEYESGATVAAAFTAAAATAGDHQRGFELAARAAATGDAISPALLSHRLLSHSEEPALGLLSLGVACQVSGSAGCSLGSILVGVQDDLVADRASHRAVATTLAGPRTSALLLAGLPIVGLVLGTAMGANPVKVLLHSSIGLAMLVVGVAFDLGGLLWTVILTHRAQP
jgi:tight adherence protein B